MAFFGDGINPTFHHWIHVPNPDNDYDQAPLFDPYLPMIAGCSDRGPVSMGAVGASAPTVFESVGASTHGFWQFFSIKIV